MKTSAALVLVILSVIVGYQGYVFSEFYRCLEKTEELTYQKEYGQALTTIDELREKFWYKPIEKYPALDIFEVDKELDYQKGWILVELGELAAGYTLFERCAGSQSPDLASGCLYQQGNIAFYQGSVATAEKKWQESLAKSNGGHDFDAQVNLELLKNQQSRASAIARLGMSSYRRGKSHNFYLRPPTEQGGAVKP